MSNQHDTENHSDGRESGSSPFARGFITALEPRMAQTATTYILAIIMVLLVIYALKLSAPVTMPLGCAAVVIALAYPLQNWLRERVGRGVAFGLTFFSVLAVFALFATGLAYCGKIVTDQAPQYEEEWSQLLERTRSRAQQYGISLPGVEETSQGEAAGDAGETAMTGNSSGIASSGSGGVVSSLLKVGKRFFEWGGLLVLIVAFIALGLMEVRPLQKRLPHAVGDHLDDTIVRAAKRISLQFQRYFFVLSFGSALTGIFTGLFAYFMGLDMAFLWGFLSFLLNYVPTLGSAIAIIPPTLFALFQFENPWMAVGIFVGLTLIQVIMGAYVDPVLEGRFLELSPLAVLFSVAFWGWVWGIPGALLGTPLLAATVIACREFEHTQWIAHLLANVQDDEGRELNRNGQL